MMWGYLREKALETPQEKTIWTPQPQLFLSRDEGFNPEQHFTPAQNEETRAWMTKPMLQTGLWTSTYTPNEEYTSQWVEWCVDNNFCDPCAYTWWVLTPREDARVFVIESQRDLFFLMKEYPYQAKHTPPYVAMIDFEAVGRDYDGLALTHKGNMRLHLSVPFHLNGWDVESTLWVNWCFSTVEKRTPVLVVKEERE